MLKQLGVTASMSRRSKCYDNAPMESFWGTLKTELIHQRHYATRPCAQQEITVDIELLATASGDILNRGIYCLWPMLNSITGFNSQHDAIHGV